VNIDQQDLKQIMDLAVEGQILKAPINIDEFSAPQFAVKLLAE